MNPEEVLRGMEAMTGANVKRTCMNSACGHLHESHGNDPRIKLAFWAGVHWGACEVEGCGCKGYEEMGCG